MVVRSGRPVGSCHLVGREESSVRYIPATSTATALLL